MTNDEGSPKPETRMVSGAPVAWEFGFRASFGFRVSSSVISALSANSIGWTAEQSVRRHRCFGIHCIAVYTTARRESHHEFRRRKLLQNAKRRPNGSRNGSDR